MAQKYKKPPIIEAITEIRLANPIGERLLEKANKAFAKHYPDGTVMQQMQVSFEPSPRNGEMVTRTTSVNHYRRSNDHEHEIVLLTHQSFVFSEIAPYSGWDSYMGRFMRDWPAWRKIAGPLPIARVGMRYMNRIDVPDTASNWVETDYLNVSMRIPHLGRMNSYATNVAYEFSEIFGGAIINSGLIFPSPISGYKSLLLDIDVYSDKELPQKSEDLFKLMRGMREKKDELFEALVTDRCRELFE